MARLPQPGADDGEWGLVLNEFLRVSLNDDGTPKYLVTPQMFGAVTDDPAIDCGPAIQRALATGQHVFLPKGVYYLSTSLSLPSKTYLTGQGAASVLRAAKDGLNLIYVGSAGEPTTDVVVRDLTLDGGAIPDRRVSRAIPGCFGVRISNAKRVRIEGLSIHDMGIVNPASRFQCEESHADDAGFGGYGVLVDCQLGPSECVTIRDCSIARIAGGGCISGDGIHVATHFSPNPMQVAPTFGILIEACHVQHVGRHCFAVAGTPAGAGQHVTLRGSTGRDAALCGLDLEEGSHVLVEDVVFQRCGESKTYFDSKVAYGESYGLRCGIAFGNASHHNTFRNVQILDCTHGVVCGGGANNRLERVQVENSVRDDIVLGTAQLGARLHISHCRFLTPTTTRESYLFWKPDPSDCLVEGCEFAAPVVVHGMRDLTFSNCRFRQTVTFACNDCNKRVAFVGCRFEGTLGISFANYGLYAEDIRIERCTFAGNQYGVHAVYTSIRRVSVVDCDFHDISAVGIYHENAADEVTYSEIRGNRFVRCVDGIRILFATHQLRCADNTFDSISGWCIALVETCYPQVLRHVSITGNQAWWSCQRGLRVAVTTGSWDRCIIQGNMLSPCSIQDYQLDYGNLNGVSDPNA